MASAGDRAGIPGGRRGFTLIELLVVLGIMMVLMGLGVAAIVSRPRIDAMIGAEQALSGAIRQARHTARSTGQPVVLRLKKAERQIAGLLREPIWHRLESWPQVEDSASVLMNWPGRTGGGLLIPDAYMRSGVEVPALYELPFVDGSSDDSLPLRGGHRLWRGGSSRNSPITLSLACKPPVADGPGGSYPDIIPLAMVIEDGKTDLESSFLGLLLVDTMYTPGSGPKSAEVGIAPSWEVLAWVGPDADRVEMSSIRHPPTGITRSQMKMPLLAEVAVTGEGFAESGPMVGGTWCELTLVYDGERMLLFRNGIWIAERNAAPAITEPAAERVLIGIADIGSPAVHHLANGAVIDDVRLERLGDALAGSLPNGIEPLVDVRITCHPDGRVRVGGASGGSFTLTSVSGPAASITIDATGTISDAVITP